MNNITPTPELVLEKIGLDSATIKSIKPSWKRTQYRAVVNWLTEYKPHANASNLEIVKGYLEAFYHLCQAEDWQRATTIIDIPLNTPTNEKLRDILGTWGYYQQQKEIFDRLFDKLNSEWECICSNGLGRYYYSTGRYESAINYFHQSLVIAQENLPTEKQVNILINLSSPYQEIGNYQKAIDILSEALKIDKTINNSLEEGSIFINLGSAYDCIGNYSKAIDFQTKGLDIARENANYYQECIALGGMGNSYFSLQDYHVAMSYYEQQLKIAEEIGDRQSIKAALGNIGIIYRFLKTYPEAITYLDQSLELAIEIGDLNGEGTALTNLGLIEVELGNLTQAKEHFEKALNIAREISDRRGEAITLFGLSQYYYRCGKFQQCITASQKYLKIMAECGVTINALPLPRWLKSFLKFSQRGRFQLTLFLLFVLIGFPIAIVVFFITTLFWGLYNKQKSIKN
ncbi:MAG: tetratricopeptide repeat protein [Okeania sp. SIO3I5]|uniref:tetratricopeptide repeat protein n=1 Tax=Okeania sp. SIO3I5 TaxID=2607805 RepID=UPI0013B60E50|nr:tetratricopeptide repeat protein [Okeania sp. SIO3I5]NEQ39307.1 tetratricopeptide repeat protein [Okeania sp. SIO3I5]